MLLLENLEWSHPLRFCVALTLGLLVGMERERAELNRKQRFRAGVRTYAILSLFGFSCAWLFSLKVRLALPAGLLAVTVLVGMEYFAKIQAGRLGWTSEIAALLTFAVGALSLLADIWVPLAVGIVNLFLLSEKSELESYVERLDKAEFLAMIKFLLVTLIILPVLPDAEYTRFSLNPARTWEILIMVSSVGFVGYFLSKRFGSRLGLWFSGILGGIVSSTAVSVAVGRIAQKNPEQSGNALQASILAGSVMYLRLLALILIINPVFLPYLTWRFILLAAVGGLLSIRLVKGDAPASIDSITPSQNPFEIRPALLFALLFALLSMITKWVTWNFGSSGLLILSAVVGVTDIDPYVLSFVRGPSSVQPIMVSVILISTMSNTVFKGIYFGTLAKTARKETLIRYMIWALLHIPLILKAY